MTIAEPQAAIDALLATRLRNAQPALWTNPARQAQPAAALPALGRTISLDDTVSYTHLTLPTIYSV